MHKGLAFALLLPLNAHVVSRSALPDDERDRLRAHQAPALAELRGGGVGGLPRLADDERERLAVAASQSPELAQLRGGDLGTGGIILIAFAVVVLLVLIL